MVLCQFYPNAAEGPFFPGWFDLTVVLRAVCSGRGAGFPCGTNSPAVSVPVPSCTHTSTIVLCVPFSQFMLHLEDEHGAFFLKGRASTLEYFHTGDVEEDSAGNGKFINHEV